MSKLEDLIQKFRKMNPEQQQNVIDQVAKDDEDAAEALRQMARLQKSAQNMQKITQKIKDLT